jgi:protein TonB
MYAPRTPRTFSAALSLGIVGLMGLALILGLSVRVPPGASQSFISVALSALPPPPPIRIEPPRPKTKAAKAKDKPSPRNLRNHATQIVAPPVVQPLLPPPPMPVATQAGTGAAAQTGASTERGPGQGAGGNGNGLGGGGDGGNGDDDGDSVIGPRQIGGKMSYRDLPDGILPEGRQATVEVRYTVNVDGRVSRCRATRSSGYPAIDTLACRLIEERFRFRPARDEDDRPVRADIIESHTWYENDH